MWLLLLPVAAAAAALYSKNKTGSYNPFELALHKTTPLDAGPSNIKVDGHGTGLIAEPLDLGDVDDPNFLTGDPAALALAAKKRAIEVAAANAAASMVKQQQSPEAVGQAAGAAAELLKIQIMEALNTPEGARTPEMTALLLGLGELPTT